MIKKIKPSYQVPGVSCKRVLQVTIFSLYIKHMYRLKIVTLVTHVYMKL